MKATVHASLCSRIGAAELAAVWLGWQNAFWCENDPFCRRVLKYRFKESKGYEDIRKTDFTQWSGKIDVLSAGFPCQPFSTSGRRKGQDDDRYLWPEIIRVVREVKPAWFVGENVNGITSMVFPGSEIEVESCRDIFKKDNTKRVRLEQKYIIASICEDLESAEYSVQPLVIPACAVGAPHRRDRIFFVAHSDSKRQEWRMCDRKQNEIKTFNISDRSRITADAAGKGLQREVPRNAKIPAEYIPNWRDFPTQPPVRRKYDGFSRGLFRYLNTEIYDRIRKTSEENRIENLPEMWQRVSKEEIWGQIGRFYSLESKEILLQTMQLYSTENVTPVEFSPFSKNVSKFPLSILRKYGEFRRSPFGRRYYEQSGIKLDNTVSFLPHEVALAAKAFEKAMLSFEIYWRRESIKAFGNAIVPQVMYEIFKAINETNNL
jgi:DNA (cytosine-5)-methyltransferase 1